MHTSPYAHRTPPYMHTSPYAHLHICTPPYFQLNITNKHMLTFFSSFEFLYTPADSHNKWLTNWCASLYFSLSLSLLPSSLSHLTPSFPPSSLPPSSLPPSSLPPFLSLSLPPSLPPSPSSRGPETQVLDYQTQQYKLLPLLSVAYALNMAGVYMFRLFLSCRSEIVEGNLESLPEVRQKSMQCNFMYHTHNIHTHTTYTHTTYTHHHMPHMCVLCVLFV